MSSAMPEEDEIALSILSGLSFRMGIVFPKRIKHYERYLTLDEASENEVTRWKTSFEWFLKKLSWKYERPLVLKSPPHTGRVKLLLDMFPGGKFIHIHRNPYAVFQSTHHLLTSNGHIDRLQRVASGHLTEGITRRYVLLYDAFFESRHLIPADRFHELSFELLEKDPMEQLHAIYEKFDLPSDKELKERQETYLSSMRGYRRNRYPDLSRSSREAVAHAWRRSFDEWGYPI
jgi:hypothetical protein